MLSEEGTRIVEKLELHDSKISMSHQRNRECLTNRVETVRRRNQSLSEKLTMFRTTEQLSIDQTVELAKEREHSNT